METIQNFLQTHYQTALPIMGILTGLLLLLAAKKEARWLFGDVSPATCNLKKPDGIFFVLLVSKKAVSLQSEFVTNYCVICDIKKI